jgi:putative addiction module antidote
MLRADARSATAMMTLKLTQIGNSVGVILPKELLGKLGVGKGDTLYAIDTPDGVRLSTADPEFEAQMEVARRIMKERWAVLRELAK